jgi:hypothetical protein
MISSDGLDFVPPQASSRSGDLVAAFSTDPVLWDRACCVPTGLYTLQTGGHVIEPRPAFTHPVKQPTTRSVSKLSCAASRCGSGHLSSHHDVTGQSPAA